MFQPSHTELFTIVKPGLYGLDHGLDYIWTVSMLYSSEDSTTHYDHSCSHSHSCSHLSSQWQLYMEYIINANLSASYHWLDKCEHE